MTQETITELVECNTQLHRTLQGLWSDALTQHKLQQHFQPRSAPPQWTPQLLVPLLAYSGDWAHHFGGQRGEVRNTVFSDPSTSQLIPHNVCLLCCQFPIENFRVSQPYNSQCHKTGHSVLAQLECFTQRGNHPLLPWWPAQWAEAVASPESACPRAPSNKSSLTTSQTIPIPSRTSSRPPTTW